MAPSKEKEKPRPDRDTIAAFARYSSLAFQMFVIIALGAFGGMGLDKIVRWKFPVFTFIFTILAVIVAVYHAIKDLIGLTGKKNRKP
ncbi:MAG: AtpZ/AtpI family protein [Bacteroidales bacterium]